MISKPFLCFPRVYGPVFIPTFILMMLFIGSNLLFPIEFKSLFFGLSEWINTYCGWVYTSLANVLLVACLIFAFSPIGKLRLSSSDEKPEFSFLSWLSMMFSAGMGIGLIYWSVAEPLMHYAKPPLTKPFSIDAFHAAISWTFLHWGLHPWAIYTTLGLALCWAVYRCHLPLTIRSCLFGLFPKKYDAWVGNTIDICAVLGTLFGVAASLGLGVMQLNAGLSELFQVPQGISIQVMLIVGITLAATFSVLSGVGKGIKWLSNINIAIACVLFGLVFFSGPTQYLLGSFFPNLLQYLTTFIPLSLSTNSALVDWKADWTHFYLGWWIAWAPFVGLFIARISKGRTIREFIIGALLLPTLLTLIWIHVFGSFGLYLQHMKGIPIIEMMGGEAHQSLFILFKYTPWPHLLSGIAMLGLFTFFITSSDSGSLVVDIITAGGNPNPPKIQKIFWAGMEGLIAITLLMLGGLKALQAAAICTGLLFSLMLILVLWNLIRQFTNPNLHQEL